MANLRSQLSGEGEPHLAGPVEARSPEPAPSGVTPPAVTPIEADTPKGGFGVLLFAWVMGAFWVGAAGAYLWGYFGYQNLLKLDPQLLAFAGTVTFLPPVLFITSAFALARAQRLSQVALRLGAISDQLTAADDTAVQSAQRLGRAVRRELDALSSGLDSAFGRMRALETALEDRVAQLEDATARAGVKADSIAQRLHAERESIEDLVSRIDEAASRAAETLAGRSAQLKAMIESAGGELKSAGNTLEVQATQFREAAEIAANAPQIAAVELDRQAKLIESAADAAVARAEFVLARQERQRSAMTDLLQRMKEESSTLDAVLDRQRMAAESAASALKEQALKLDEMADQGFKRIDSVMTDATGRNAQLSAAFGTEAERVKETAQSAEAAIAALVNVLRESSANALDNVLEAQRKGATTLGATFAGESRRLDELTEQGLRRLDVAMINAAARSTQIAAGFGKDVERVKETADLAGAAIERLVENLREGATNAQALIAQSAAEAKHHSTDFVGDAMGVCDRLLRAAAAVAEEAEKARVSLIKAVKDTERHMVSLPGIAVQEAERVREALRNETEQILDTSARTLATLQARVNRRSGGRGDAPIAPDAPAALPDSGGEGLRGLARRITGPKRRVEDVAPAPSRGASGHGGYELSAVLAAAEARDNKVALKSGAASALSALQAALADLAGDLNELAGETADPALWRRYLDGDRGVFVRRLAASIGPESVNRIAALYRDNSQFHDSADAYLEEFEQLLARARDGDRDGFLASTLLTADTGKIYLAIAYALGRLE